MFSREEKIKISKAIESVLKEINHPEMDITNIKFNIHIEGEQLWSFADIHEPKPETSSGVDKNPWNEKSREILDKVYDFKVGQRIDDVISGESVGVIIEVLENTICLDSIREGIVWSSKKGISILINMCNYKVV